MKCAFYTSLIAALLLFFSSCTQSGMYEQASKTLDSLSGAVSSIAKELQDADTILLQKTITRYTWYRQFIQPNINDTISKEEADNLQHFYASGRALENFAENRKMILSRAQLVNSQHVKLGADIKNKALSTEELRNAMLLEKNEARRLIELAYGQQRVYHASLEEFKTSLKGVELLIRSRNKGELPTIVKDTVAL